MAKGKGAGKSAGRASAADGAGNSKGAEVARETKLPAKKECRELLAKMALIRRFEE
ncbi:MAG: hypothetical protein QOD60_2655, partial [Solirubrobacterales bacterium]|nr:hypothetical protein [Solirubrobacterales bacterium]